MLVSKFDTDDTDINLLIPVTIDPYMLVEHMRDNMTYVEIYNFIVMLDERMADWDFTLMVEDYFSKQYEKYMEENDDWGK